MPPPSAGLLIAAKRERNVVLFAARACPGACAVQDTLFIAVLVCGSLVDDGFTRVLRQDSLSLLPSSEELRLVEPCKSLVLSARTEINEGAKAAPEETRAARAEMASTQRDGSMLPFKAVSCRLTHALTHLHRTPSASLGSVGTFLPLPCVPISTVCVYTYVAR
jgi:hypothetical protein